MDRSSTNADPIGQATGTKFVVALTSEQVAGEVKELGHGIFTYTLLQGLRGGADGGKQKDGVTTAFKRGRR